MTDSDLKILEAAFAEAIALDGDARTAMLAQFAAQHPALEQQLADLLAADAVDDTPLEAPIASSAEGLAKKTKDPWEGRRVGVWTVTRRLAEGGMGAVFLAERADDAYQQTVALKVMSAQMLARDAETRFRAERQILASLSHPNIAQLIDGGTTDDGLPYFVLEYVDGLPIDVYCDQRQLSVVERLRLFTKVCDAVDYAHRNLVVHRDLKPSNILVDANGEPKLLDFGIAKLLQNTAIELTAALTRAGSRAMTPEYASPEQVRGEPISVATDVYALGVLLYRMLTGRSPYGSDVTSKMEIERAIVSSDPKRPSTVVTEATGETSASSVIDIGMDASRVPESLRRSLHGDLDTIILKSLQKDADRRYPSVRVQADDIHNHLEQRPITARPDTLAYRSRKFAARNRVGVLATAAFVVGAIGVTLFYTNRLAAERDIAEQQRAVAEQEREAAEQITNFLVEIFSATQAGQPDAETVTIREVLDRGADKIDESLAEQPLIRARILQHIARTYASIARYDDAEAKYADALAIFELETGASADTAHALYRYANSFLSRGQWQSAQDHYLESLAMHRAQPDPDQGRIAEVLRLLVYTSQRLGDKAQAEDYLNAMLTIMASIYGPSDSKYANGLYSKASLLLGRGQYEEAIVDAREALRIIMQNKGAEDVSTVNYRHLVGLIEWDRGNYGAALEQYEIGIAIRAAVLGDTHPSLFNITFSYGATLAKMARYEDAAASHRRLLGLQREALGPDAYGVAYTEGAYGMVLLELERTDDAEVSFINALRIWELGYGTDYIESGVARIGLGHVARARGDADAARSHYLDGIRVRELTRGEDHPATARAVASLADLELEVGNWQAARQYYQRALAIYEDPEHPLAAPAATMREQIAAVDAAAATQ